MAIAQQYQDRLDKIKKCVIESRMASEENNRRFVLFRKFLYESTMSQNDVAVNKDIDLPVIQFNITEPFVSRLMGEFSKQEPSVEVTADSASLEQIDPTQIKVIDGFFKHIIQESDKRNSMYEVQKDLYSGGFSYYKIKLEYSNPFSWDQMPSFGRVFDPTLCGHDPTAQLPDKSDGMYCFELYPLTKEEFERQYPNKKNDDISFYSKSNSGFQWSYKNGTKEIVILCEFYEKKIKRKQIVQVTKMPGTRLDWEKIPQFKKYIQAESQKGVTMFADDYKKFAKEWQELGIIAVVPAVMGKPRWTDLTTIVRYVFTENEVLEAEETDFNGLPIIYVPGNDVTLKDSTSGQSMAMSRPIVYNARDTQRLKNFSGQCLTNRFENMTNAQWIVAEETYPTQEDFQAAFTDPQKANIIMWRSYNPHNPMQPLPMPQLVPAQNISPEIMGCFVMCDQLMQMVMGSFDASLGINNNQLSGVAIQEGATQSNAVGMPYIVGHMNSLSTVFQVILDVLPKIWKTALTLPVTLPDGKKAYIPLNSENGIPITYASDMLKVHVKAGVNFEIQKQRALSVVKDLAGTLPAFGEMINAKGLPVIVDNLDIRGADQLRRMADDWTKQQEEAKNQPPPPNPEMMKIQLEAKKVAQGDRDLDLREQKQNLEAKLKAASIGVEQQAEDNKRMEIILDSGVKQQEVAEKKARLQTENFHRATELAIKAADAHEGHEHNLHKLQHEIVKTNKEHDLNAQNSDVPDKQP